MLSPNTILQNRYLVVRKLGEGGMGAVYEAIDQRVSCVVALKETLATRDLPERAFGQTKVQQEYKRRSNNPSGKPRERGWLKTLFPTVSQRERESGQS